MDIALWIVAGGLLGWASCEFFKFNEFRGRIFSAAIGAVGGFLGGKMIAPLFATMPVVPGELNVAALAFAAGASAAVLLMGHFIYARWQL